MYDDLLRRRLLRRLPAESGLRRLRGSGRAALGIPQLRVSDLNLLNGFYVNLEYPLPNGGTVKLLNDADIYWGNQIERPGNDRCYGIVGDDRHLLVCEYGCNGSDPEILVYQKRGLRTP